jgi:hypothetical protein
MYFFNPKRTRVDWLRALALWSDQSQQRWELLGHGSPKKGSWLPCVPVHVCSFGLIHELKMIGKLRMLILLFLLVLISVHLVIVGPGAVRLMRGPEAIDDVDVDAADSAVDRLAEITERVPMSFTRIVRLDALGEYVRVYMDIWDYRDTMNFSSMESGHKNAEYFMSLILASIILVLVCLILFPVGHSLTLAIVSLITFAFHVSAIAFYFSRVKGDYGIFARYTLSYDADCVGMHLFLVATVLSAAVMALSMISWRRDTRSASEYYVKSTAGSSYRSYPKVFGNKY